MSARKKKAPKRGRPALPEGESKSMFALRLNVAEREEIARAAVQSGKSISQWARDALAETARLQRSKFEDADQIVR